jgi:hypothetical protein
MNHPIRIMADGTRGRIFDYAITGAKRALVSTENVADIEVFHV